MGTAPKVDTIIANISFKNIKSAFPAVKTVDSYIVKIGNGYKH